MAKQVTLGDSNYAVQRFTGYKALRAGRLIARITKHSRPIMEEMGDFARDYEKKNALVITKGMSKLPRFAAVGFTEEDFDASGGEIRIPQPPSLMEQIIAVFPSVFEVAEGEVLELLALLVMSNSELRKADNEDRVDDALKEKAKEIMFEADLDQMIDLLAMAQEVLQEQFAGKEDKLGKLKSLIFRGAEEENSDNGTTKPTSSTSSPDITSGTETPSSTEPLGVPSPT
jgi:hypothetical protein